MQRKWRRTWKRGKPYWVIYRPATKKNNVVSLSQRLAKRMLPPVAAAGLLLAAMTDVYANPAGGQVTSGAGAIAKNGNMMTVTQNTNKMSVNWQSFNIAANETVNFVQPSASAIALNRVIGNDASNIYGHLNANGRVFLINPNGVLFAPGAQVNVGGLVASTQNISDSNFLAGNYTFSGSGGPVVNQGAINAASGGYVALLGNQVSNQGVIVAKQGTVALGAGSAATLDFNGDGLLSLAVSQPALHALVENKNLIQADGGQVIMTAGAADALAGTVVNNTGVIQARGISNVNGQIILSGGTNGTVSVSGALDASGTAAGQTGGTIKVLGNTVTVDNASLNASGDQGGGSINICGDSHGQGPDQNAATTTIGQNTTISADALTNGNGGNVVVWADGTTNYGGSMSVYYEAYWVCKPKHPKFLI